MLGSGTVRRVRSEVDTILHLPFMERVLHHKARRPIAAVSTGVILMLVGSMIASYRHELAEWVPVHHLLFDTGGYFLHAIGALPALRYVEPLWTLIMGAEVAEVAAEVATVATEVAEVVKMVK